MQNINEEIREMREQIQARLDKMEKKTMTMLVCTGFGTMLLLLISIFMMMKT